MSYDIYWKLVVASMAVEQPTREHRIKVEKQFLFQTKRQPAIQQQHSAVDLASRSIGC